MVCNMLYDIYRCVLYRTALKVVIYHDIPHDVPYRLVHDDMTRHDVMQCNAIWPDNQSQVRNARRYGTMQSDTHTTLSCGDMCSSAA